MGIIFDPDPETDLSAFSHRQINPKNSILSGVMERL